MFERKHTQIFPEGVSAKGIEKHDEEIELAKYSFLKRLHLSVLRLEDEKLLQKGPIESGNVFIFTPEELVKLGMKDKKGKLILGVEEVMELLGLDEKTLESEKRTGNHCLVYKSDDGASHFYRYETTDPILKYVVEVNLADSPKVRNYFQIAEEDLRMLREEWKLRASYQPRMSKKDEQIIATMGKQIDEEK